MKPIEYKELFERELFESCIPFWLAHGVDGVNGGLYSCLDREGNIYSTDKSVWMQGRCAYMFSKLSNTFGARKEWLDLAKSCLDFLEEHCIDSDGRMYFTVTKEGKPLRKRRYMFSETFYIIANAEYYKATGDETALKRARKYYDFVCAMYDDPASDPYKITPKSVPGVRDTKALAVPMILLNVTAVMLEADKERYDLYDKRARSLVEDVKSFRYEDTGFMLESVGLNGEYYGDVSSARVVNRIELVPYGRSRTRRRRRTFRLRGAYIQYGDRFRLGLEIRRNTVFPRSGGQARGSLRTRYEALVAA